MGRNRLKIIRIVVSSAIFVAATLLWIAYSDIFLRPLGWISRIQVFPAAMVLSMASLLFWLAVSFLFGRVYCSSVCPLGTWLDGVAHVGMALRRKPYRYSRPFDLRSFFLLVTLSCIAAGIAIIPVVIEPYCMYSKFVVSVLKPAWGAVNNLIAYTGAVTGWWDVYYVGIVRASVFGIIISVVTMLAVSIPAWFFGRTFCNTLCPVGTMLGYVSRYALCRIDIDTDRCTNCRRCEEVCKASCIDLNDHVVDGSRCVNCFNCLSVCKDDAIFYRTSRKRLSWPLMQRLSRADAGGAAAPTVGGVDNQVKTIKQDDNEAIS